MQSNCQEQRPRRLTDCKDSCAEQDGEELAEDDEPDEGELEVVVSRVRLLHKQVRAQMRDSCLWH